MPARLFLLSVCLILGSAAASPLGAHPIPRKSHDRTLDVHLTRDAVVVEYLLELDSWTVVFVDLPATLDAGELLKLTQPREFYEAFTRTYAPILASNIQAELDGEPLSFSCVDHSHVEKDSVQCSFRFRASWEPRVGQQHTFTFREGNYETEPGLVKVSLSADEGITLTNMEAADEVLRAKPITMLGPGEEELLRKVSATFTLNRVDPVGQAKPPPGDGSAGELKPTPSEGRQERTSLEESEDSAWTRRIRELLDTPAGFWAALALAALWGAGHALAPGHGKTLVAAYLVGERGTVWHALLLGLTTTVSHTGVVWALAMLFRSRPDLVDPVAGVLPLLSGGLIAAMGAWLFFCRLTGRADHVHLGGGHHHHHHDGVVHHHHHQEGVAGHHHDAHGHTHALPVGMGWGRLIFLGITGGIVPCTAAILLCLSVLWANRPELLLPLLLSFSIGLSGVLVAIGVGVVYVKGFATARWKGARVLRVLPVLSAMLVTCIGLWMCYSALNPGP